MKVFDPVDVVTTPALTITEYFGREGAHSLVYPPDCWDLQAYKMRMYALIVYPVRRKLVVMREALIETVSSA